MWQKGVLLAFVEAVDFIDEQDGTSAGIRADQGGTFDGIADVFHTGEYRRECHEFRIEAIGHQACQCRFADTGGAPQDHRVRFAGFKGGAQGLACTKKMLLPDDIVECFGTHAFGQRCLGHDAVLQLVKETVYMIGCRYGKSLSSQVYPCRHFLVNTATGDRFFAGNGFTVRMGGLRCRMVREDFAGKKNHERKRDG